MSESNLYDKDFTALEQRTLKKIESEDDSTLINKIISPASFEYIVIQFFLILLILIFCSICKNKRIWGNADVITWK